MPRSIYKKIKNRKDYFFYRLKYPNLKTPQTISSIRKSFIASLLIEPLQSLKINQKVRYKKLGNLYNLELN